MKIRRVTVLIVCLLMSGCAELVVQSVTPAQAQAMTVVQLCTDYAINQTPTLRAELVKRQVFSAREWQGIDSATPYVGESNLALFCTAGYSLPQKETTVNDENGKTEIMTFLVHIGFASNDMADVYVRNDVVVMIQNYSLPNT